MENRSYSGLRQFSTFEERFEYLSLKGIVSEATFGFERYLNQKFYTSREWRTLRHEIIARDEGADLGVPGYEIYDKITIHHIIPMTPEDLHHRNPLVLDPNNLITVSPKTHNAIHYGDISQLQVGFVERRPGDTKLW